MLSQRRQPLATESRDLGMITLVGVAGRVAAETDHRVTRDGGDKAPVYRRTPWWYRYIHSWRLRMWFETGIWVA